MLRNRLPIKQPKLLSKTANNLLTMAGRAASMPARVPHRLPDYAPRSRVFIDVRAVSEPGFDEEGRARMTDSAWSMAAFKPDGSDTEHIYVGTNTNIIGLSLTAFRKQGMERAVIPAEVRRFRPDVGAMHWESVLDYAELEEAPYRTFGFRTMAVYRSRVDGRNYLYAGTAATRHPSIWRTATGNPGDWEEVFVFPYDKDVQIGSVRGMAVHEDGLLYFSTTRAGDIMRGGKGQIWATDGNAITPVVEDSFGNPDNSSISILESFAGALYAGTYNPHTGFEVWKLRDVNHYDAPPKRIVSHGAGHAFNEVALSMRAFKDHLYVGTGIPLGFNPVTRRGPRGCSMIRVDVEDQWELVVGPQRDKPISNYGPGFGWYLNAYCWYMAEHRGYFYAGTWDASRCFIYLQENRHIVHRAGRSLLKYLDLNYSRWGSPPGGDLYRSADGVRWEPVLLDGMGNPDNHGIRTLESTADGLYIGTENPFSRAEVWRLEDIAEIQ